MPSKDYITEKSLQSNETAFMKEDDKNVNNALANTDFSKNLQYFLKMLLMAKYSCVRIYEGNEKMIN